MPKRTKPFIFEIKASRRKRTGSDRQSKSLWGRFAPDFKQSFLSELGEPLYLDIRESGSASADLKPATVTDIDNAAALPLGPNFMEKWGAKRAEKPKAGPSDVVTAFLIEIERQKALFAEFQADPAGFAKWRSAWFRQVTDGFGVSIGYGSVDVGSGLRYLIVSKADDVAEFLDDLARHTQTDTNFQNALRKSHLWRVEI